MDLYNNCDASSKGVSFYNQCFCAANPNVGFTFKKQWVGKNKVSNNIKYWRRNTRQQL